MSDLTPRQRALLEAIVRHISTHGYPPSIKYLGEAVGLSSTSSVAYQLNHLAQKGYIRRDKGKPRAISIVGKPVAVREEW